MSLDLNVRQNPNLSQRMIQSGEILQMTAQELENYLDELSLENPVMDVEKPAAESIDAYHQVHAVQEESHYLMPQRYDDDDYDPKDTWNFSTDRGETLREHLWMQLDMRAFSNAKLSIINFLLNSLDERGYISEDMEDAANALQVSISCVEEMVRVLQGLEPTGVCARNLSECLRLQLAAKNQLDDYLEQILDGCLEMVARSKYAAIAGKLNISASRAAQYCELIRSLDPKPGSGFADQEETQYVVPDLSVIRSGNQFRVIQNHDNMPKVFLNGYYRRLSTETEDQETKDYLEKKIQQAEWVCQCITQRQTTLQRVAEEILQRQMAFFAEGPDHIQSLKMSDVAAALEIHESTVSRAVNHKYLQCAHGVYPMSWFFQRKATARDSRAEARTEQDHTSGEIKRLLREIIENENKNKPFSDRILCEKLSERGITISRRTVAKYRDEAGIPDASGRKLR